MDARKFLTEQTIKEIQDTNTSIAYWKKKVKRGEKYYIFDSNIGFTEVYKNDGDCKSGNTIKQ